MTDDLTLIDRQDDLAELCQTLTSSDFIAVDTEFIRERTYFPRLCLVQVATDATTACIDALAIDDLAPLTALLFDTTITKVLHAARQDFEIFHQLTGQLPGPLFDTQIAADLCGMGDQEGLAAVATRLLSVEVGKSHARTDWSRRPLSDQQLRYALDDVLYLIPIYAQLDALLQERDRRAWLDEDCARLLDPSLYVVEPETAWQRLRGLGKLPAAGFHAARLLAKWREERAMRLDRPRGWVLRDEVLLGIAGRLPDTTEALGRIRGLPKPLLRKESGALLDIVAAARACEEPVPAQVPPLTGEQRRQVSVMMEAVRETAAAVGVSAATLATRRDLNAIVRGDAALPLTGWRRDVIGARLLQIVAGTD